MRELIQNRVQRRMRTYRRRNASTMRRLPSVYLQQAKDWLADCVWADVEAEEILMGAIPDDAIGRAIARHFDGSIPAFVEACQPASGGETWQQFARRHVEPYKG